MNLNNSDNQKYDKWEINELISHILESHHAYLRENIPVLEQLAQRVATSHGDANPVLIDIKRLVGVLIHELQPHMEKEENILFPNISKILDFHRNNSSENINDPAINTAKNLIIAMIYEHENAKGVVKKIRQKTNDYTPFEDACKSTKAFYLKLKEFQDDLFQHIYLEDEVLFPKVEKLIENLTGKSISAESEELNTELDDLDDELF
jgi:regulator of cell morphogenesis and NO signaling